MIKILSELAAFSDPSSPWYYIVGVGFLVLIFAALAIFIVYSKKHKHSEPAKKEPEQDEQPAQAEPERSEPEKSEEIEQKPEPEEKKEEEIPTQTAEEEQNPPSELDEIKNIEFVPAARHQAKPFIDRLIAETEVHGVYNELKNTILSYPGIKAKITKDEELFYFGEEKKASIALDDGGIQLYLALDPFSVPEQFTVKRAEGDLPSMCEVPESSLDSAVRLIIFVMNVSLLTRNDNRRHVDYVANAIKAKQRAKNK